MRHQAGGILLEGGTRSVPNGHLFERTTSVGDPPGPETPQDTFACNRGFKRRAYKCRQLRSCMLLLKASTFLFTFAVRQSSNITAISWLSASFCPFLQIISPSCLESVCFPFAFKAKLTVSSIHFCAASKLKSKDASQTQIKQ